jgi:hypothetical protein
MKKPYSVHAALAAMALGVILGFAISSIAVLILALVLQNPR